MVKVLLFVMIFSFSLNSQTDTLKINPLPEVVFTSKITFKNALERRKFLILKRKVYKVYGYAKFASDKKKQLDLDLKKIKSKRKRRKFMREFQKGLKKKFSKKIKKLTMTEGQILCKIIHRNSGVTVYDMIKKNKSGWSAFWWNVKSNIFNISLRKKYSPNTEKEDSQIEYILTNAFGNGKLIE